MMYKDKTQARWNRPWFTCHPGVMAIALSAFCILFFVAGRQAPVPAHNITQYHSLQSST
jgi:hypothetical protein